MRNITKAEAINYYFHKKGLPIKTIRELAVDGREGNFYIINENYIIRYIIPEAMNCFMRNQNFEPRISGTKITKADLLYYLTSNKFRAIS